MIENALCTNNKAHPNSFLTKPALSTITLITLLISFSTVICPGPTIPFCKMTRYSSKGTPFCVKCVSHHYLVDGGLHCPECDSNCLECSLKANSCTSCPSKTNLNPKTSTCYPCISNCDSCKDETSCSICSLTYYYEETKKQCSKCITNCDKCTNGKDCVLCSEGTTFIEDNGSISCLKQPRKYTLLILFVVLSLLIGFVAIPLGFKLMHKKSQKGVKNKTETEGEIESETKANQIEEKLLKTENDEAPPQSG